MTQYSPFFQTLYDQTSPVGNLGRGTHYTVLRAVVFHNEEGQVIPSDHYHNAIAKYHDFAVIWDEDHDVRIIKVIERVYQEGLLPCCTFFGERKGSLTVLASSSAGFSQPTEISISIICDDVVSDCCNDVWSKAFGCVSMPEGIINAPDEDVVLFLKNIQMLWGLGCKDIPKDSA